MPKSPLTSMNIYVLPIEHEILLPLPSSVDLWALGNYSLLNVIHFCCFVHHFEHEADITRNSKIVGRPASRLPAGTGPKPKPGLRQTFKCGPGSRQTRNRNPRNTLWYCQDGHSSLNTCRPVVERDRKKNIYEQTLTSVWT